MIEHTQRKHARLSASRTERFMECPGSVRLENLMPYEPAGEAAATGTRIHELGERLLNGEMPADMLLKSKVDSAELAMAQQYADFVNTLCESPRKRLIEVNVDEGLKSLHPSLGGTADAILVEGNMLHVIDLKTGRIPVEAENNKQMLTYALGAMRQFNAPASVEVTMHIFQPRTGHSKWVTTGERLVAHGLALKASAELALSPDAPTNPGADQCRWCKAKTICPSLHAESAKAARLDFAPNTDITSEMMETAQLAMAWSEAVIEAGKQQLLIDKPLPGWTLRTGRKTKFWSAPAMVEEALRDNALAWELKSPSQIAKLGIDLPEGMIGEKLSAPSLVREK